MLEQIPRFFASPQLPINKSTIRAQAAACSPSLIASLNAVAIWGQTTSLCEQIYNQPLQNELCSPSLIGQSYSVSPVCLPFVFIVRPDQACGSIGTLTLSDMLHTSGFLRIRKGQPVLLFYLYEFSPYLRELARTELSVNCSTPFGGCGRRLRPNPAKLDIPSLWPVCGDGTSRPVHLKTSPRGVERFVMTAAAFQHHLTTRVNSGCAFETEDDLL